MPLYHTGDTCKYTGDATEVRENCEIHNYVCHILDIKSIHSGTMRPLYWVRFDGVAERYPFGIHEHNLKLLKRRPHSWEV